MKKSIYPLIVVIAVLFTGTASATNGYWSHGYGPKSKSIGGACVAMAFGAMCAASNPGSLVIVGNRLEVGASVFAPTRGFVANSDFDDDGVEPHFARVPAGKYTSRNDFFLIPHFAYNRMLDDVSSIGVAVGANGGMNTDYESPVFVGFGDDSSPVGIDMKQMFIGITYSRKLNEQHSIGITPVLGLQTFEAKGLNAFAWGSLYPQAVTDNGMDISYGAGLKLGWLWQVNDRLNIGASYQSRMWMTDFDDYKGLFAEGGNFDIPSNYDIGFSYKVTPEVTFAYNFQRINFSEIPAIGNASDIVMNPLVNSPPYLGCDDCLGFGWDDASIHKFGIQWQYSPALALRAGYSRASDIVPGSQALFNILAPAVVTEHYTFGFGRKLTEESEINVSFSYMPEDEVYGTNPNTGPQTGSLFMNQWEIEVGWATRF